MFDVNGLLLYCKIIYQIKMAGGELHKISVILKIHWNQSRLCEVVLQHILASATYISSVLIKITKHFTMYIIDLFDNIIRIEFIRG